MWDWIAQGVILVAGALVPSSDLAQAPNPYVADWRGTWESALTPKRGPIELNITSATSDEVMGTGMVGGTCGAKMTFRGKIEDGKLVIQEDLGRPCGITTLTIKLEGDALRGTYRNPSGAGDVVMVKQ